jgi:hypothetical protein
VVHIDHRRDRQLPATSGKDELLPALFERL